MRIALATAAHYPQLAEDDRILRAELVRRGIDAVPVVWDADVEWSRFDVVVVRSIWDYHLKHERFRQWLAALDASGAHIHNATDVLRWNTDKRYMVELEQRGVRITPTRVIPPGSQVTLADVLNETGWYNFVVKPCVSSTGYETWFGRAPGSEQDERRFADQTARMDTLVQEFADGIRTGEWSFIFIDGEYQHCILKRAAAHEFRVHIEHGGTVERVHADTTDIAWARSVVDACECNGWTYGRVDAVRGKDGLLLMELELLDPELFFAFNPAAVDRFIERISR